MKNIFYIIILFFFSCGEKNQQDTKKEVKPLLSVVKKHSKITSIASDYKKEVENWEELNVLNSFVSKFKKTSANGALSNALELKDLVKNLKDSIIPKKFDTPSFKSRINILNNEVLRLTDLTFISSITASEVNNQVDKVLSSYSSLNAKINTLLSQKRFEDAIDIDVDINFIGLDSTKIDSISKKSIKKERDIKKLPVDKLKNKKRLSPKALQKQKRQ